MIVATENIMDNTIQQGLICREQFAHREGHSRCTKLRVYQNELAKFIKASDSFDVIMFDFKSAFEPTTHSKLSGSFAWESVSDCVYGLRRSYPNEPSASP